MGLSSPPATASDCRPKRDFFFLVLLRWTGCMLRELLMGFTIIRECYTRLLDLKDGASGFVALVRKICLLGGPVYGPPANLWKYMYFFWYDSYSKTTDGSSVTPEPYGAAPDFHECYKGKADIGMIIDALKDEEFAIAPGLDHGEKSMELLADFKSLSLMCQQFWKSNLKDLLAGSTTKDTTAGFYAELLRMEKKIMEKMKTIQSSGHSCCMFPSLLQNALKCFEEKLK